MCEQINYNPSCQQKKNIIIITQTQTQGKITNRHWTILKKNEQVLSRASRIYFSNDISLLSPLLLHHPAPRWAKQE